MTDRELCISLREMGRAKGMCDKFYDEWKDDDDIDTVIDRFVPGFDFCVKQDYPSLDFVCKNFRKDVLHRHNIYVDEEVDLKAEKSGYYCFLGTCTGKLYVDDLLAVTVYVRHHSDMDIIASNGAKVFVYVYDGSNATCINDGWSFCKRVNK